MKGSQSNNQYALPGDDEEEKEEEYSEQEMEGEIEME